MSRRRQDAERKPLRSLNLSRDWLLRMAELEGNGCISVGGLAVDMGLYRSGPEPQPTGPSDRELLREAREILRKMVDADTFPAMFQARVWAEAFLALHGEGEGSPVGVISNK